MLTVYSLAPGDMRDEAVVLAFGRLEHVLRQVGLGDALAQLVELDRALVGVAELALDRLHLLAQVILALVLVDRLAHAALQLLAQLERRPARA